ncbi:bis(5'-nucleosyl)-tetraphosphatase (symmetrical) YqeK [uncultured Selenomonas sp.]|uniref:bis(5'-nucleosyl)-tetraphosphatase (symmetrical) YqeK n=1 Tax=uncultured Selenomonas sp. TaxID=159275 RepID=UPI0028DCD0C0|nr:bis(5'-nucleosyl)-tetraphosphatase (symmetrical) YqeK [uncultured Selenomonas sp.]
MNYEAMKEELSRRLQKKRYEHSLGVADTAAMLAERFGADVEKARVAGLLHDCAREYKTEDLASEAARRSIDCGEVDRAMPLLLHAYVGARRAQEVYGVTDPEILQAIWRHTVGGEHMTTLDKIVYFADMIEPQRDYPEVDALRELSRTASLDTMALAGLSQSILFVLQTGRLIHPATVAARNEILLCARAKERRAP